MVYTRREFRKKHRELILVVKVALFAILIPLTLLLRPTEHEEAKGFINRKLLQEFNETLKFEANCTPAAILEFPTDGFTREQRQSGWISIHCLLACYSFVLLAIVCDDYFVPSIERLCHKLKMREDVAGATFMAAASSSPELFINTVGTFVTEGDIGVGTIVGSAVFNILAVPACCGLLAGQVIDLDWWAVSRDSIMYGVSVIALIFTLEDHRVEWYEATILVVAYALYITAMYFNEAMDKFFKKSCCCRRKKTKGYTEITPLIGKDDPEMDLDEKHIHIDNKSEDNNNVQEIIDEIEIINIWKWPESDVSIWKKLFWVMTWPISFLLWITVPDCKKFKKLYFLTFFMCIIWIGFTSYFTAWMITVIGDTISIPDSVMGLTFLAAGTSVPEAVSSIIVTNQGHGSMGISSSIGSNTFDILLCLGLPWFIKSNFYPTNPEEYWVNINSTGLTYSAISLFSTLLGLYISFACNKFKLDWKIGLTCTFMYAGFLSLASLIEMNYFFPVNLPTCKH